MNDFILTLCLQFRPTATFPQSNNKIAKEKINNNSTKNPTVELLKPYNAKKKKKKRENKKAIFQLKSGLLGRNLLQ